MTTRQWKPIYVKTNKTFKKSRAERSRNKYKSILPSWMVSGWKFKRLKWLRSKENTIKSTGNPWIVLVTPELQKGFQMINPHRYLPLALLGRPALPTIKKDMNQWHLLKWRNFNCTFSNNVRQFDQLIVRGIAILYQYFENQRKFEKMYMYENSDKIFWVMNVSFLPENMMSSWYEKHFKFFSRAAS